MPTSKLTLSADARTVSQAKQLAKKRHTSVSALFARFIAGMADAEKPLPESLAPGARRALGLAASGEKRKDRDLLADALLDRYKA